MEGQSMPKDQTTQTDTYLHGLTAKEEALLRHRMRVDQERITQEYEDNIRILEEKSARFEALYTTTARELARVIKDNSVLKDERDSISAMALNKEKIIRLETTKRAELEKQMLQLQGSMPLHDPSRSQEELFSKTINLQRQLDEIKLINRDITANLSEEIKDLNIRLHQSTEACQRLEQANFSLRQQLTDLKDQQLRTESRTPSTPGAGTSLATEFWNAGESGPLRRPTQEIVLEDEPVLINELFIERQKNNLMAAALVQHSRDEAYRLKGGWVNTVNRDRLLFLLDQLKCCKENLQTMAVASFMKVIHDVEATIHYVHLHQQAYASLAFQWDLTLFFSHNQEGIKNSIKTIAAWELNLKRTLNQNLTYILNKFNDERGDLARFSQEDVSNFRDFCTCKVSRSIKYCILGERVSGYKSHSFRAYLHHLRTLTGLRDSALAIPTIDEINEMITQRQYTMAMMEEEEYRLIHPSLDFASLEGDALVPN